MRRPSLLRRLIMSQVVAMLLAWAWLFGWLMVQMLQLGNGDLDRRMYYLAQALAESASAEIHDQQERLRRLQATERIFVAGVLAELNAAPGYAPLYQVWSASGELLYRTPEAPAESFGAPQDGAFQEAWLAGERHQTVAARSSDGRVRVHVAERSSDRLASNWPMIARIAASQLLIFAWCVLVMWWAARGSAKPMRQLSAELAGRASGDLTPLRTEHVYAETAPIVEEVNALLARESRRLDTERGFLADAAHELRTPLAAMSAQAHLLRTAPNPAERHAAATELGQGIDRVSHLLAQLLAIARMDAGHVVAQREPTELTALVRQSMASQAPSARARGVTLALEAPEGLQCAVDRQGFVSMVDNLLDNAIRYTPAGGHVEVSLAASSQGIELAVRDDGPGIPPAEREKVFERFYRMPGTVEAGSGLGLSIVRQFTRSHPAVLRLDRGLKGKGLGVLVTL